MNPDFSEIFKFFKFYAHLFSYPQNKEKFFQALEEFFPFEDRSPLEELKKIPFEKIQAEWTRLFVSNFGGVPCKPYQSVFQNNTLMGAPAWDTEKFYELFSLEVPRGEMPDHISLQLDFLTFLLEVLKNPSLSPEEVEFIKATIKEFFYRHVLWILELAKCVERNTSLTPMKILMKELINYFENKKMEF